MVVIVHTFDTGVQAHVVESWLDYYLPYAELKGLLVLPQQPQQQRWALLRRLLPRRVLAVLPQYHQQHRPRTPLGTRRPSTVLSTSVSSGPLPSLGGGGAGKQAAGAGAGAGAGAAGGPVAGTAAAITGAGDSIGSPGYAGVVSPSPPLRRPLQQPQQPPPSSRPAPPPTTQQQQHWQASALDNTLRLAAAAKSAALALATPPGSGHSASTAPNTRPSPSPSTASSCAGGVITMADLGRSDSLERTGSLSGGGAGGCLDLGDMAALLLQEENGGSPAAREVRAQLAFLERFKAAADRCNTFFVQESDRLAREHAECVAQLKAAETALATIARRKANLASFRASEVWAEIKAVYKNLHREVKELRSFSRTNFDLAIRLVKAYRKAVGRSSHVAGAMWRYLRKLDFTDDKRLYALTTELEQSYAEAFSFGFVGLAHKELYASTGSDWHVFRVGLRFGGAVTLLSWVLWNALFDASSGVNLFRHPIVNVYAAVGGGLLLVWTWALNLAVWERAGVDYRAILQFKTPMTSVESVFAEVSTATTVYLANLLLYYKLLRGVAGPLQAIPSLLLPVLLVAYALYKMVFPWERRRETFEILAQIVIAPFGKVEFIHLFLADTLTSFNKVSFEAVLAGCYMVQQDFIEDHRSSSPGGLPTSATPPSCGPSSVAQKYIAPLVIAYPLWLRLLQSLKRYYLTAKRVPPLPNAIKYGLSLSVILFSLFNPEYARGVLNNEEKRATAFKVLWILAYTLTTLLTWLWDVMMDWGLFDDRRTGLRRHLLFRRHAWVYYLAIVLDLALRFLWTVSLLPDATSGSLAYFQLRVRFLTPLLEIMRRSMWAWLRLEREQAVRDEQEGLLDGVTEAKRRKRACKNRLERTRRLAHIREEVARLTKAVQLIRRRSTRGGLVGPPPLAASPGAGGAGGVRKTAAGSMAGMDGSASRSGIPGVGAWDEDVDDDTGAQGGGGGEEDDEEEEEDEEEEVLESQKVMQRDLVSHRSVVVEVCLVLLFFVGVGIWAAGDH